LLRALRQTADVDGGFRLEVLTGGTVYPDWASVDPLHKDAPKESLTTRQPMGKITEVKDILGAVFYLARADQVTGEVIHVDGGAHAGRW
jgi:NAD(P)-dependent dehydrogenase (short-subunit alcohol dehydrogenase family)